MFDEAIWGLDIGSTAVRVVRLARRGAGFEVTGVDRIDTYRDPASSSVEEMDAALRKALSIFTVNHRIGARDRVGVAIPGLGFQTLLLDLPPVASKRLADLVDYEVRSRVGDAAARIVHAYRELPSPSVNERLVIVAVGSADDVGGYLDALETAGIAPDRVTLAPHAFVDALRFDGLEVRDTISVRAGVGATDVVAGLREGPLAVTEAEGTLWIARALRERMGLGAKEAEGERRAIESGESNARSEPVAAKYVERLAERIQRAIQLGRARSPGFQPSRILLVGEGSRIRGVSDALVDRLGLPVEVHSKWNRIAIGKHLFGRALVAEIPAFIVALGAALDAAGASSVPLSLIPRNRARETARSAPWLLAASAALAVGCFAADRLAASASRAVENAQHAVAGIQTSLAASRTRAEAADRDRARIAAAELAERWPRSRDAWARVCGGLLESIDPEAVILHASVERGEREDLEATVAFAVPRGGAPTSTSLAGRIGDRLAELGVREIVEVEAPRPVSRLALDAPRADADATHDLYRMRARVAADGPLR